MSKEVKDIIKEERNIIVPSYEYRDYYREDGSRLYNSNREANWYKIGVHDCFDYFEQNRLKACDNQTPQEAWREAEFVVPFVKEHHRQPTFSDAIEETRKHMIDKVVGYLSKLTKMVGCSEGGSEEVPMFTKEELEAFKHIMMEK